MKYPNMFVKSNYNKALIMKANFKIFSASYNPLLIIPFIKNIIFILIFIKKKSKPNLEYD